MVFSAATSPLGSLLLRGRTPTLHLSRQNPLLSEAEIRVALLRRSAPWAALSCWQLIGLLTVPSQERQQFVQCPERVAVDQLGDDSSSDNFPS